MSLYTTIYDSPWGEILLMAEEEALIGLWLPGQTPDTALLAQAERRDGALPLMQARDWLNRYFCGLRPAPGELVLAPRGSDFRKQVWRRLCEIPYGTLVTYGQIAREMTETNGHTMSAQAVGGAVGHNPISLIIPCHRVVGSSGSLVGYAGGLVLKRRLLRYEGVDMTRLHDPIPTSKRKNKTGK